MFQHFRLQVLSLFFVLKCSIRSTNCTYLDSLDLVDSFFTFLSPLLFQLTHMCLLKNFCQKQREKVFPKCTMSCLEMRCIRCMLRTILQTKQRKKRLNSWLTRLFWKRYIKHSGRHKCTQTYFSGEFVMMFLVSALYWSLLKKFYLINIIFVLSLILCKCWYWRVFTQFDCIQCVIMTLKERKR